MTQTLMKIINFVINQSNIRHRTILTQKFYTCFDLNVVEELSSDRFKRTALKRITQKEQHGERLNLQICNETKIIRTEMFAKMLISTAAFLN